MQMTDSRHIPASPDAVWTALNDPDVLKQCIPGCESLEKTSPTEMTANVVLKIGPVKAKFAGKVTLSDVDPPHGYRITGEGSGGVSGYAKGGATVRLEADGADATILHYEADAQVGGKLAQLGGRLIDSTAQKLAGEFFAQFSAVVAPQPEPEPVAEPAEAAAPTEAEGVEEAAATGEAAPDKKGWFKGLFSRPGATTAAVALLAACFLFTHACCLGHGSAEARTPDGFPICSATAA
jgi:carbon monoxide dehydrogenase subunit G